MFGQVSKIFIRMNTLIGLIKIVIGTDNIRLLT